MTKTLSRLLYLALLPMFVVACGQPAGDQHETDERRQFVVVYSAIEQSLMEPVYRAFSDESGVRVQQVTADNTRLLQMLREKHSPPADLILAESAAVLWGMAEQNVFRPTHDEAVITAIPERLRDADQLWSALSLKASVIVLDSSLEVGDKPASYESLAEPQWKGRLCLSSSSLAENAGWVSMLIDRHGEREAELRVRHMVANLAQPVFDESTSLVEAIESAQCAAGIANLGAASQHLSSNRHSRVEIIMPMSANGGTLVDVIGAGVARHAGNPDTARRLMLWMVSDDGQRTLARQLNALPAAPSAGPHAESGLPTVVDQSDISAFRLGALYQAALNLAERARYR